MVGPGRGAGRDLDHAAAQVLAADLRADVGVAGGEARRRVGVALELGPLEVEARHEADQTGGQAGLKAASAGPVRPSAFSVIAIAAES